MEFKPVGIEQNNRIDYQINGLRIYTKPTLSQLGTVIELTAGGGGSKGDLTGPVGGPVVPTGTGPAPITPLKP